MISARSSRIPIPARLIDDQPAANQHIAVAILRQLIELLDDHPFFAIRAFYRFPVLPFSIIDTLAPSREKIGF